MSNQNNQKPKNYLRNEPTYQPILHHHHENRFVGSTQTPDNDQLLSSSFSSNPNKTLASTQTPATLPPYVQIVNDGGAAGQNTLLLNNSQLGSKYISATTSPMIIPSSDKTISITTSSESTKAQNGGDGNETFTTIYVDPAILGGQFQMNLVDEKGRQGSRIGVFDITSNLFNNLDEEIANANKLFSSLGSLGRMKVPPGLNILQDVDHLFIQPGNADDFAEVFLKLKNKYDVIDCNGERLYYAGELLNVFQNTNWFTGTQKFQLKLLDSNCRDVLSIYGKYGVAKLFIGTTLVGLIEEVPKLCVPHSRFLVKDALGNVVFQLVHETGNEATYEYEVFNKDEQKIGRMSKTWVGLENNSEDESLPYSYGVDFPINISVKKKTLLLASLFVLYFKYVGDTYREQRNEKCAWCCLLCGCVFGILLIIGFSFLAAYLITK